MHHRWPPRLLAFLLAAQGAAAARPRHTALAHAEEAAAAAAGAAARGGAPRAPGAAGEAPAEEHRGAGEGGEVLGVIVSGSSGRLQRARGGHGHQRHPHHRAYPGEHGLHEPRRSGQAQDARPRHHDDAPAAHGLGVAPAAEAPADQGPGVAPAVEPAGEPDARQGRLQDAAVPLVAAACWLSDFACGCGNCTWRQRWLPACEERASRGGAGPRGCGQEPAAPVVQGPQQDFPVFFLVVVAAPVIALGGAAALSSAMGVGKGYCAGDARKLGLSRAELEERISAATKLSDQQRQALLDRFCGCTSALDVLRAEAAEDEAEVLEPKPF